MAATPIIPAPAATASAPNSRPAEVLPLPVAGMPPAGATTLMDNEATSVGQAVPVALKVYVPVVVGAGPVKVATPVASAVTVPTTVDPSLTVSVSFGQKLLKMTVTGAPAVGELLSTVAEGGLSG